MSRDRDPLEANPSLRVLVADDEGPVRMAVRMILEERGHEVVEAADALAAYQLATSDRFDALLVDVRMPGGGLALIERLRTTAPSGTGDATEPAARPLAERAILLTADLTPRAAAMIAAGQPHLRKPFRFDELVALVEEIAG